MTDDERTRQLDRQISTPSKATVDSLRSRDGDFAVLGAGGKMGFHLCWMLRDALNELGSDRRLFAVSRFGSVRNRDEFDAIGCETVAADLSDPEQLRRLPDVKNVFYMAGVKFGTADDPGLLEKMNVTMPKRVAERFQRSDIVAFSTGCVYSFVSPESGGSTEASETNPVGAYAQSCVGRERAFFDAAETYGTRSALIRLNYSIDCRYGVLVDLAQKVLAEEPVDISMGYVNLIWQGDALGHTIQSLPHVAAPPFVINITGPAVLKVRDLATAFGQRFDKTVSFVGREAPTAWLNNAAKSHQMFGKPDVEIETMIDRVTDWITSGGQLLGKPTHFETRDGNY